jgi:hypothetical protein
MASAISLSDADGNKLGFGIRLQNRIDFNQGINDSAGDPITDQAGVDTVDFYLRRVRLYMKGQAEWGQKFNLTLSADNLGNSTKSGKNDTPRVRYAWVAQEFKTDAGKHIVKVGLQKPYFMRSYNVSSSKLMTTSTSVVDTLADKKVASRDLGISYAYKSNIFAVHAHLTDPSANDQGNRDWQVGLRVETSLSEDTAVKKLTESFLGKEGFHHLLGIGVGMTILSGVAANDDRDDTVVLAADYTIHYNALTAVFDFGLVEETDNSGFSFAAGAAYAFPMESGIIEPALRLQIVDLDETDTSGSMSPSSNFGDDDGTYGELSLNYYMAGHDNKIQAALYSFTPEEGDGDAIGFRIQHQLNF